MCLSDDEEADCAGGLLGHLGCVFVVVGRQ